MNERQLKELLVQALLNEKARQDMTERVRNKRRMTRYLALKEGEARLKLAAKLIEELGVTSTQHVGAYVMRKCFAIAARTATLDDRFAQRGRRATVKYMDEARAKVDRADAQVERYRSVYDWYVKYQAQVFEGIVRGLREGGQASLFD